MSRKKKTNQHGTPNDVINATFQQIPHDVKNTLSKRAEMAFKNGYFTKDTLNRERLRAIGLNEPIEFIQWLMFNVIKPSEWHHINGIICDFYNDDALHEYHKLPPNIKNAYKSQYKAVCEARTRNVTPAIIPPYHPYDTKIVHFKPHGSNKLLIGLLCGQLIYDTNNNTHFTRNQKKPVTHMCVPSKVNNLPKKLKRKMDELNLTPLLDFLNLATEKTNIANQDDPITYDKKDHMQTQTVSEKTTNPPQKQAVNQEKSEPPLDNEPRYTFDEWLKIYKKMRKLIESERKQ